MTKYLSCFVLKDCSGVLAYTGYLYLICSTETFLQSWKLARVCPVFTSSHKSDVLNFQLILIPLNVVKLKCFPHIRAAWFCK